MSSGNGKPEKADLFARIEQADEDDDVERILAMDDAALDAELAAGGFDPEAVRAKGRAIGEQLMKAARHARLVKTAKIGGIAAGVVAVAVGTYLFTHRPRPAPIPIGPEPIPSVAPRPAPPPLDQAVQPDDREPEKPK